MIFVLSGRFLSLSRISTCTVEITQYALKGQKLLAQGSALGCFWTQICRPVRAKALKIKAIHKAVALTGRLADCSYTQGAALGYGLLPLQGVQLVSITILG